MNLKNSLTLLSGLYIAILVWWFSLFISGSRAGVANNIFSLFWTLIAVLFSLFGISTLIKTKTLIQGYKESISFVFFNIGITLWSLGNSIWVYYNLVLGVQVPFPSYADLLFLSSYPPIFLGALGLLGKKKKFQHNELKTDLINKSLISFAFYLVLLFVIFLTRENPYNIKLALNIIYVSFDILYLAIILFVFFGYLLNKWSFRGGLLVYFFLMLGVLFELLADVGFFYTTVAGTYYNGGLVDLCFLSFTVFISFSIMTFIRDSHPHFSVSGAIGSNYLIQLPYMKQISLNMIYIPVILSVTNIILFQLVSCYILSY